MSRQAKTVLALLALVAALMAGLCFEKDMLFIVSTLKVIITLLMITALLIYYGYIKVSELRYKRIQKVYWYLYVLVIFYMLPW